MRFALEDLYADLPAGQLEEAREFYRTRPAGRGPGDYEELKTVRALRAASPPADPPAVEEIAEADGRRVPVRVLTPSTGQPRGVHLDIHGGGFYMDSAARGDVRNRALADALGVTVVSVDYRLAPEHPWPAAPDEYFITAYAGHAPDRTNPDISPIFADLHSLPPTLLVVGSADVVLEDTLIMAARLSAAGNQTTLHLYPDAPHGFTTHPTAMAQTALTAINSWLQDRLSA
ncbi:alpha/beta hydrolase [Actinocorallia sp. A-T 12471]|uniref:alpha/beta hydrolase n=1 Tax=Actinocorallia sp. A-T 12471 TaxID=3089813 RepID=UPI0029D2A30D|nr:alpha/beta hydrolase fold domain-containing protein [Actinocorallia sp. A-T 12471]MDX6741083.1 alpha/beta hydrolase fold domain-containing protein [Actinocorallia sp. A-T 12471]